MVKEIPLQNGAVALVDDEDYEKVNKHIWSKSIIQNDILRVATRIDGNFVILSHYILGEPKCNEIISFKNGDKLDFRKSNLIIKSRYSMAVIGRGRKGSISKYKGVTWNKHKNKWQAQIKINGKNMFLGRFSNEDDAARKYNEAVRKFRGDEAFVNTIGVDNNVGSEALVKIFKPRKKGGTTSKYRGVNKKRNSFVAQICKNQNRIYIGSFKVEEDAAKAYDKKALELFGDKAILNFPKVTQ